MHDEQTCSFKTKRKTNQNEKNQDGINYNHFTSSLSRPATRPHDRAERGRNFANEKSAIEIFEPFSLIRPTWASIRPVRQEGRHSASDKYNLLFHRVLSRCVEGACSPQRAHRRFNKSLSKKNVISMGAFTEVFSGTWVWPGSGS